MSNPAAQGALGPAASAPGQISDSNNSSGVVYGPSRDADVRASGGGARDAPIRVPISSLRGRRLMEALNARPMGLDGIDSVRELVWLGVPDECSPKIRSDAWKLLLDPSLYFDQEPMRTRKRVHYFGLVSHYFDPIIQLNSQMGTLSLLATSLDLTAKPPEEVCLPEMDGSSSSWGGDSLAADDSAQLLTVVTEPESDTQPEVVVGPGTSADGQLRLTGSHPNVRETPMGGNDTVAGTQMGELQTSRNNSSSENPSLPLQLPAASVAAGRTSPADVSQHGPSPRMLSVSSGKMVSDRKLLRQIRADLIRTSATGFGPLFKDPRIQFLLTRVLYVSSVVNPASGYVQGMNDLLVPFVIVFLLAELGAQTYKDIPDVSLATRDQLESVETAVFVVIQKLLLELSELYVVGQPGIRKLVKGITCLTRRLDKPLLDHFKTNHVDVLQFAFRWVNCLLSREIPPLANLRLWDSFLAEGLSELLALHRYVCSAFLRHWSPQLMELQFPQIVLFLQALPTNVWGTAEVGGLISEAFVLKSLFENSPGQLINLNEDDEDDLTNGLARGMLATSFDTPNNNPAKPQPGPLGSLLNRLKSITSSSSQTK